MLKNKKGFTLIELMIVISILGIMAIGISQMNFGAISSKQRSEIFSNKIKATIETVKNNSLIGKGVGSELIVPKKWKIDFTNGSESINTSYDKNGDGNWENLGEYNIKPENSFYEIKAMQCVNLDNSTGSLIDNNSSIIIEGSNLSLSGCTDLNYKILEITSSYKQFENTFRINTVSGVIEDIKYN